MTSTDGQMTERNMRTIVTSLAAKILERTSSRFGSMNCEGTDNHNKEMKVMTKKVF